MMFAVKDKNDFYYCGAGNFGAGLWDKQLRKAKIYTSWEMAVVIRDDDSFVTYEDFGRAD